MQKEAVATFVFKVATYGKSTIAVMPCFWPVIELRTSRLSVALLLCPVASHILAFIIKISANMFLQQYKGEAVTVSF
jgi:hypothetical protein